MSSPSLNRLCNDRTHNIPFCKVSEYSDLTGIHDSSNTGKYHKLYEVAVNFDSSEHEKLYPFDSESNDNAYNLCQLDNRNLTNCHITDDLVRLGDDFVGITLSQFNVRSLLAHLEESEVYVSEVFDLNNLNILGIRETGLNQYNQHLYCFDGYKCIAKLRAGRAGGWVAIFLSQNIEIKVRKDLDSLFSNSAKVVFIEICLDNNNKFVVGEMYRPPKLSAIRFLEDLGHLLEVVTMESCTCYLWET